MSSFDWSNLNADMNDPAAHPSLLSILQNEDNGARQEALCELRARSPAEALAAAVALLNHPEGTIRQRAGGFLSLLKIGGVNISAHADALARYLRLGEDPRVRLSCVIVLMSEPGPKVTEAYLHALKDPFDRVAQIACLEVGDRAGAEGTVALFGMLTAPSWRVRLEACKALITQKTADQRVVTALETMAHEPEASVYDAEIDDFEELDHECEREFGTKRFPCERWGKLGTILAKARHMEEPGSA